ncbi:DUF6177 family protein [Nocardiopsis salina]|uniref:DUF6177 family protein n=1 Tax=Nocardiopsis salina TaxID=245836 RepID=UPI001EF9F320|nr:DUF6177 family protein [Nocardiopsis salina]
MNAVDIDTRIDMCGIWEDRLKSDAEADLTPVESIERWQGVPGRSNTGEIVPGADLHTCPDMPALDQILNPGTEPPEDIVGKFLSDPVFLAGREWGVFVATEVDAGYKIRADGEIIYRPVRKNEMIIGYLWASNSENARGYVPRPAAGAPAWQAEGWWIDQVAEAAGRGMTPVEALRERIAAPKIPTADTSTLLIRNRPHPACRNSREEHKGSAESFGGLSRTFPALKNESPMSLTLTALLEQPPGIDGLTRALVAAGPELRVRLVSDGAFVQLRDEDGHLVATVRAAEQQTTSAEAERVLDAELPGDLPAQPWWVEARATTWGVARRGAGEVVRRLCASLVRHHGGVVHEPEYHPSIPGSVPLATPTDPVTAAVTEHTAVLVEDRPLVPASTWVMEALAAHARERRGVQIVTSPGARVTRSLAELLTTPLIRWVVAEGGGHRDGFSAEPLSWDPAYGFVSPQPGTQRAFPPRSEPDPSEDEHLLKVSVKAIHPADPDVQLGSTVEFLAEGLVGGPPALMGANERTAVDGMGPRRAHAHRTEQGTRWARWPRRRRNWSRPAPSR